MKTPVKERVLGKEKTDKVQYDWRFENSINQKTEYLEDLTQYSQWRTDRYLSNFIDTIMYVNDVNLNPPLDDKLHYDYLFHSIKKRNRFYKKKKSIEDKNFLLISEVYKYNKQRTREALKILTSEQIEIIRKIKEG
jgi:hypothetical protein